MSIIVNVDVMMARRKMSSQELAERIGITTVEAKCDDAVIAQKIMAVNGGSWRVVELTLTVDQPGEHTITVGDLSKTINIIE